MARTGAAVAVFVVLAMVAASAPQAQDRVPVVIGGDKQFDACGSVGQVTGLDPDGDGFLSVRVGPGTGYDETDRLYNGDLVHVCEQVGSWYAVIYPADGRVDCGVSTSWPEAREYSGRCQAGWAHMNWIAPIAG